MIAGDGDVGFTWRKNDDYIEVGFPTGKFLIAPQSTGSGFMEMRHITVKRLRNFSCLLKEYRQNNRIQD